MTIRLFQAALTAASLALLPSLAQAQQPSEQPPIGDPVPFELPETRSFTLDNGLEVTFIPFGLAPTVNLSLQVAQSVERMEIQVAAIHEWPQQLH